MLVVYGIKFKIVDGSLQNRDYNKIKRDREDVFWFRVWNISASEQKKTTNYKQDCQLHSLSEECQRSAALPEAQHLL